MDSLLLMWFFCSSLCNVSYFSGCLQSFIFGFHQFEYNVSRWALYCMFGNFLCLSWYLSWFSLSHLNLELLGMMSFIIFWKFSAIVYPNMSPDLSVFFWRWEGGSSGKHVFVWYCPKSLGCSIFFLSLSLFVFQLG